MGPRTSKEGPVALPVFVKKIRAPIAEMQIQKVVTVMLLVAGVPDLEMNLEAIPLDTESVINPVAHPVMAGAIVLRLEIVMTPACQLVTALTAGLTDHAPPEDDTKSRLRDPKVRIAAGPPRDQGPGAAAAMAAPSSEGPAVLLAEESLWSAGPCYIGHLRRRLLAAARAPGVMRTSLMTIGLGIPPMTRRIKEVKDVLRPSRPTGALPKEKATSDATAPRAKRVVARARLESRRGRALESTSQRPSPQGPLFSPTGPGALMMDFHLEVRTLPYPPLQRIQQMFDPQRPATGSLEMSGLVLRSTCPLTS